MYEQLQTIFSDRESNGKCAFAAPHAATTQVLFLFALQLDVCSVKLYASFSELLQKLFPGILDG